MKTSTLVEPSALFQTAVAGMCRVSALCISLVKQTWFTQRTETQRHSVWIHWASRTVHLQQDDDASVLRHATCCSPDVTMDTEVDLNVTQGEEKPLCVWRCCWSIGRAQPAVFTSAPHTPGQRGQKGLPLSTEAALLSNN